MKNPKKHEAMEPSKKRYNVNHQKKKNARNTAINLNYKRKEQNNTEQWIQQRINRLIIKQTSTRIQNYGSRK